MPAEILKHTGLEETRQALKQFARLPREAKVRELLLAMQSGADSAMARHCLNAEAANKNGIKEDAKASEDDARTAAFTTWTQFAVQAFCAEVDTTKQGVGTNEGGKFPKATLVTRAAKIPAAVVLCYPALMEALKAVEEHGDDMVAHLCFTPSFTHIFVTLESWDEAKKLLYMFIYFYVFFCVVFVI